MTAQANIDAIRDRGLIRLCAAQEGCEPPPQLLRRIADRQGLPEPRRSLRQAAGAGIQSLSVKARRALRAYRGGVK